jgi:hypothetical protein
MSTLTLQKTLPSVGQDDPVAEDSRRTSLHELEMNDSHAPITAALAFSQGTFPEGGREAWLQVACSSVILRVFDQPRSYFSSAQAGPQLLVSGRPLCVGSKLRGCTRGIFAQRVVQILQDALLQTGVAGAAALGLVGALGPGLEVALAIPASKFSVRFGIHRAAALGSLLCGLGPLLGSFTTHNYAGLLVTQGIMYGLGSSLCFVCSEAVANAHLMLS